MFNFCTNNSMNSSLFVCSPRWEISYRSAAMRLLREVVFEACPLLFSRGSFVRYSDQGINREVEASTHKERIDRRLAQIS